ncbi:DUF317 domain-containing protein [Streptomyces olivoreticuli]
MLGDRRHADRILLNQSPLADIASLNHWTVSPDGTTFTSPDEHCALRHTPDAETAWSVQHSVHGGFDTHWNAHFTRDTPAAVVAQFFAHLSTTAAVERTFGEIPFLARDLGDALITPVRGASVNPHVHHAAAQAARSSAARPTGHRR